MGYRPGSRQLLLHQKSCDLGWEILGCRERTNATRRAKRAMRRMARCSSVECVRLDQQGVSGVVVLEKGRQQKVEKLEWKGEAMGEKKEVDRYGQVISRLQSLLWRESRNSGCILPRLSATWGGQRD